MTHLEKFIALYGEVGIGLVAEKRTPSYPINAEDREYLILTIDDGAPNSKTTGRGGFFTELYFDDAGNFIEQGIWE